MSHTTTQRIHGLDAVRGGALLLGIFFHAAFSFFPGDQIWLVVDSQRSDVLSGGAFTLHMFRMTTFFLLAGYFGRMQTYRLGTRRFMFDRLKRIGIPLVVFWPIVMACFIALAIWSFIHANGGAVPENPPESPPMTLANFPLTHLWFLYMLLLLYAGTLLLRAVLGMVGMRERLGSAAGAVLDFTGRLYLLPLLMAVPVAYLFTQIPNWQPFFGIPTPEYGFVPNLTSVAAYGGAFGLGWLLHRQEGLLQAIVRAWPVYLAIAGMLTTYCLATIGTRMSYMPPLAGQSPLPFAAAYALGIWFWTFGLIGLCLQIWSKESPMRRYIADSSYWLYLIHLPIVMALQVWMSKWALPAEVKYVAILGISIPLMLLSYEVMVRYTFLGGLLNGRKRARPRRKTVEVAAE